MYMIYRYSDTRKLKSIYIFLIKANNTFLKMLPNFELRFEQFLETTVEERQSTEETDYNSRFIGKIKKNVILF